MPNLFPPRVTAFNSTVELGKRIAFSTMFSVADLDPSSTVTRYRFRDNDLSAASGYFLLNGVRQSSQAWHEIDASQLTNVFFNSALVISNETISVQAFDGLFWSDVAVASVFSVVPNLRAPVISAQNASILSSEGLVVSNLVSATDPDGYPIQKFLFVDRSFNSDGGFFSLYGTRLPSATWFTVNAADMVGLRYIGGQSAGSENIGIQAFDGAQWSAIRDVVFTTIPNNFAPTVQAFDLNIPINRVISGVELFKFTDLDGNTIKKVQFFDTGSLPTGGFFTINGVVQAPNAWFEVTRDQLATVEYHTASNFDFERFRVKAFDGKFWSTVSSAKIVSVTPPDIIIPRTVILETLEERAASTTFTLTPGPAITKYQIVDLTEGASTAKVLLNGTALTEGVVRDLTPAEFAGLEFKGGWEDNGREFDTFALRVFNGVFWSSWTNINVHTNVFAEVALDSGQDWGAGNPRVLTYSFINGIPGYYATSDPEFIGGPQPLNSAQRAAVRDVLDVYETMLNVDFVEIPQLPGSLGDFTFGLSDLGTGILGWAYFPSGPGKPGDIWLNKTQADIQQMTPEGRLTIIHEMGHALGLTHTFQEAPDDFTNLPAATESQIFNMMSYTRPSVAGRADTPMLYDLVELQKDYGANTNYNVGNTMIRLPTNYSDFRVIWDAGGIDTLDLENQPTNLVADLREGRHSSVGGVDMNVAVAYGTVIENLTSGIGSDKLFGNEVNNTIIANAGNDEITGFGGNDVLRGGAGSDKYFYTLGDDFDTIDEETLAGRELLTVKGFGAFNSLAQDMSFRVLNGLDLDIQLTLDGGESLGGILIKNMGWGGSRIETLRLQDAEGMRIGPDIDLRSIFVYSTSELTKFRATEFTSEFGTLAVPV